MGMEIERKFLVDKAKFDQIKHTLTSFPGVETIYQGYLISAKIATVRVRWSCSPQEGRKGFMTVKGSGTISRPEFQMEIDSEIAAFLLSKCSQVLKKKRYQANFGWEIDEFENVLDPDTGSPLVVAEIELSWEGQPFSKLEWIGKEVTEDFRYTNANLATLVRDGGTFGPCRQEKEPDHEQPEEIFCGPCQDYHEEPACRYPVDDGEEG